MSQAYPIEIVREIDQRWRLRAKHDPPPATRNHAGGGPCPTCNRPASIAPVTSEYRGNGLIHHHWQCNACGHEWITALHVPA